MRNLFYGYDVTHRAGAYSCMTMYGLLLFTSKLHDLTLFVCRFLILLYHEEVSRFSLEQNSGCRQAFIHYCGLHLDLMKSTVMDESLSTTTTRVLFQRESTYYFMT